MAGNQKSDLPRAANDEHPDKGAPKKDDFASGGEDESSTEKEGDDSHLHEDQKSPTL